MAASTIKIDYSKNSNYYIFEYLFFCKIPNLNSMSVEYIRHFGMTTTGNKDIDAVVNNQLITVMIPISAMVEYYRQGIAVYITEQDDILTIYNFISHHLNQWKEKISRSINSGTAPVDDLIAMDEFANSVYENAKYQFTREIATSLFTRQLSATAQLNKNNFFKQKETPQEADEKDPTKPRQDQYPTRISLASAFKGRYTGEKKWN